MKDLIVISYATHRAGLLDEYEQQLKDARIDFHLEPVELADGINSVTARWKFDYMRRMCERFADCERIVFTDAWDVLFVGSKAQLLEIDTFPMVAGERNCWPDNSIASEIMSAASPPSHWRFCNAGVISGNPAKLWGVCQLALSLPELERLEQDWFNRHFAFGEDIGIDCDEFTEVAYTVSPFDWTTEMDLIYVDAVDDGHHRKWWNRRFNTYPQFFHFSGKCPTEPFRAMLRGDTPSLVSP
jgi:hypothetical protein